MSFAGRDALLRGRVSRLLGWSLTGVALGFVGWQLTQGGTWQLAGDHLERLAPAVLLGAITYALASFLLAEAWRQLLGADAGSAPAAAYHAVYGRTQIIKYLPGNVFHFAGRQILGRCLGHEQAALALASMAEILLLLLVAASLAAPLVPRWLSLDPAIAWTAWIAAALAIAIAAVLTIRLLIPSAPSTPTPPSPIEGEGVQLATRFELSLPPCGGGPGWGVRLDRWRAWSARITPLRLCRAALLYAAFFVIGGVLLWLLTLSAGGRDVDTSDLAISISALALAWMAGFVTPGSSAGFGVREAVLIMALQSSLDREAAVLVALAMRLVTLVGDILFLAASLALPLPRAHSPAVSTSIN